MSRAWYGNPPVLTTHYSLLTTHQSLLFHNPRILGREELLDLRFSERSFSFRSGALVHERPARRSGGRRRPVLLEDAIDTTALFAPPLEVEGRWAPGSEAEARALAGWIVVGFGGGTISKINPSDPSSPAVIWTQARLGNDASSITVDRAVVWAAGNAVSSET